MSQPFDGQGMGRRDTPVTSQMLEDRINVYISAMDRAFSMNDTSMSSQLQRDIQQLVDLMEKVQTGQAVTERDVPPPLVMTPMNDVLANPLGELSSRLADYHKALYFAEEELSEGRINKIQALQKGLQTIHSLQKRAQAGFPIREDEVPPPVIIPSDSEFDDNAFKTITERLEQYNSALKTCLESSGTDRRRIPKLQSGIRTLEFLLTRAKANRPVWRKDIPAEFEYCSRNLGGADPAKVNKAKVKIKLNSLITRVSKVKCERPEQQNVAKELNQKLTALVQSLSSTSSPEKIDVQSLMHQVEALEMMSDLVNKDDGVERPVISRSEDLDVIETRLKEYREAALKAKKEGRVNSAIKHLKVIKGLNAMKDKVEKGVNVDMTLVPPPPKMDTPVAESLPPLPAASESGQAITAHAQVTDVNTKPTVVESNKSKLARKLALYLDLDGEPTSPVSTSSSSFESDSAPSPVEEKEAPSHDPLPRPHSSPSKDNSNSSAQSQTPSNPPVSSAPQQGGLSLSNICIVSCGNRSDVEGIHSSFSTNQTTTASLNEMAFDKSVSQKINISPARTLRGHIDRVVDGKGADDSYMNSKITGSLEVTDTSVRGEPVDKPITCIQNSSKQDSNSGGALDSIGFLSCQDVPSFSAPSVPQQSSSQPQNTAQNTVSNTTEVKTDPFLEAVPVNNNIQSNSSGEPQNVSSALDTTTVLQPVREKDSPPNASLGVGSSLKGTTLGHDEQQKMLEDPMANSVEEVNSVSATTEQTVPSSSIGQTLPNSTSNAQCNFNQSNSVQDTHLSSVTNGHTNHIAPALTSDTDISSNTEDIDTVTHNSEMSYSKDNSFIDPVADLAPFLNQNVNVNGFKSDLPKALSSLSSSHKADTPNGGGNGNMPNENTVQGDSGESPMTDSKEFEDLMNSMSMPSDPGKEPVIPLSIDKESSGRLYPGNGEQLHQKNETVTTEKSFSSLPVQSDRVLNNENTKPSNLSFQSLPTSFPALSSVQNGSQGGFDAVRAKTVYGVNDASSVTHLGPSQPLLLPTQDVPSLLYSSTTNVPLSSFMKGMHSLPVPSNSLNSNSSRFTCLETLKYDILIADAKNSEETRKEAENLRKELEAIKDKLRKGRRKIWDEYKNRVEYELQVLNNGVKQCQETQNWEEYKYLNSKRMLNERELALLNQRICEIQD